VTDTADWAYSGSMAYGPGGYVGVYDSTDSRVTDYCGSGSGSMDMNYAAGYYGVFDSTQPDCRRRNGFDQRGCQSPARRITRNRSPAPSFSYSCRVQPYASGIFPTKVIFRG